MARYFNGTNEEINWGDIAALEGIADMTIFQWKWNDNLNADRALFNKLGSAGADQTWLLWVDDVGAFSGRTDTYSFGVRRGTTTKQTEGDTNAAVANAWQSVAARSAQNISNGQDIWVDNTQQTDRDSPNNEVTVSNTTDIKAGETAINTLDDLGGQAHIAFWDAILSIAEIGALSRGVNPRIIRDGSLQFYAPLNGHESPEPDYVGQVSGTLTGTTKGSTNPPVELLENYL